MNKKIQADLIIRNAKTVNNEPIEIAIQQGKIIEISPKIEGAYLSELILEDEEYISAGWIDMHVHCFSEMDLYKDNPDAVGVKTGVTTIVDAGSCGALNIDRLYKLSLQEKTNVYAFLNVSDYGIIKQDELSDLNQINFDNIKKAIKKYPEFIVGLKARMSQSVVLDNDTKPLKLTKKIQNQFENLNLMVHIGSAPPRLNDILNLLDARDIITHTYNGKANHILNEEGKVHDFVLSARQRGVHFDLGHGSASFDFEVAKKSIENKFMVDTISTDIYQRNRLNGPVYDMATTISKIYHLGYGLNTIIEMITEAPAKTLKLKNKGYLKEGYDADLTIFKIIEKDVQLEDSNGKIETAHYRFEPTKTIIGGTIIELGDSNE